MAVDSKVLNLDEVLEKICYPFDFQAKHVEKGVAKVTPEKWKPQNLSVELRVKGDDHIQVVFLNPQEEGGDIGGSMSCFNNEESILEVRKHVYFFFENGFMYEESPRG